MAAVIVFGGSGYIGSHVVEQLLAAGHSVTAPVRASSSRAFLDSTAATVRLIDFSEASLREVIKGHTVVYNCLADPRMHNAESTMRQVEIDLTRRVLHAAAAAGAQRFVQLSTIQVYGFDRPGFHIDESWPPAPVYRFSRVCADRETLVLEDARRLGLPVAILRPATVLGARDQQFKAIITAHKLGVFMVVGDDARFSAIDARDAGRAMALLGECEPGDEPVYLVKGFDTSWLQLKTRLDQRRRKPARLLRLPKALAILIGIVSEALPYRLNPPLTRFAVKVLSTDTLFDDSRIRKLGYAPKYSLEDALEEY